MVPRPLIQSRPRQVEQLPPAGVLPAPTACRCVGCPGNPASLEVRTDETIAFARWDTFRRLLLGIVSFLHKGHNGSSPDPFTLRIRVDRYRSEQRNRHHYLDREVRE